MYRGAAQPKAGAECEKPIGKLNKSHIKTAMGSQSIHSDANVLHFSDKAIRADGSTPHRSMAFGHNSRL